MGIIVFNNIPSTSVGIEVSTFPQYTLPEKEYETVHIPGKSGDLVIDTGSYKNVTRSYQVNAATYDIVRYDQKMNAIAEWLHSTSGYCRLEDTYEPDFFRLAYYQEGVSFENLFNEAGQGTLNFICKPQRFYKTGDVGVKFTENGKIQNRTNFTSKPLLHIVTNDTAGTVTIGSYTIGIKAESGINITVDCDLQDAYYGTENKNYCIVLNDGEFPKLTPGENVVSFTGGIISVEVIPRWWTV